jgi:hypothetical protein
VEEAKRILAVEGGLMSEDGRLEEKDLHGSGWRPDAIRLECMASVRASTSPSYGEWVRDVSGQKRQNVSNRPHSRSRIPFARFPGWMW